MIHLKLLIHFTLIGISFAQLPITSHYEDFEFPELKYVDESIDPCDNFYKYSCGNFEKYNSKPENEYLWDNFKIVQTEIQKITHNILRSPIRENDASAVKKAKDMYNACLTPLKDAEQTIKPLYDVIDSVGGWPLIADIPRRNQKISWNHIAQITAKYGLPLFLDVPVGSYVYDTNMYMILLRKDSLALPLNAIGNLDKILEKDIDYVSFVSNLDTEPRSPYLQYLIDLSLKFVREDLKDIYKNDIIKGNEEVLFVLQQISRSAELAFGQNYSEGVINNVGDLQEWSDQFSLDFKTRINWVSFFNNLFSKSGAQVTEDTKVYAPIGPTLIMLANILNIIEITTPDIIMNVIVARLFTYMAPDTNLKMWEEFNELYKSLKRPVYSREDYCFRRISNSELNHAIAHEFQNYHFDLRKTKEPQDIINVMMTAFFELIDENNWIDDHAREWVKTKANAMLRLIAFPDLVYNKTELDNYFKPLEVCLHDHFGNSQKIRAFNFANSVKNIDKIRDRNTWSQSPLIVNAYYNQLNNRITFPASIMNTPFYTGESLLVDYSRIGALIAHEITHGFDTKGRKTNAEGSLVQSGQGWHDNVIEIFNEKSECFVEQYSKYHIDEINVYVDGSVTLPENIADNGGIREAFRAFQKLKNKHKALQNFSNKKYTADQLFFISYATMWCKIDTNYSLEKMHEDDDHAPNRFRVIGTLSNMKEFSESFNCSAESKMNPKKKCVLW